MKIRNGFVSNSSSSSFLLYGVCIEESDEAFEFNEEEQDFGEELFNLDGNDKLEVYCPWDDGLYFVGITPSAMEDNQTMGEFKEMVKKKLNENGIDVNKLTLDFYSESWYS